MLRSVVGIVGVLAVVFWTSLAQAAPCAGFTDVDDTDPFCVNVEWMKNRGITLGLTPTLYDPNSPVTRLQMAAFMYRLGFQNAFLQGGSAFGTTAVLGTTDNQPLEVHIGGQRAMRYERTFGIPSVIGGSPANSVAATKQGGTIAGGGGVGGNQNVITNHFGAIGGGERNNAGDYGAIPGGWNNTATGLDSFAAGSYARADADRCAVFSLWGAGPGMPCFGTSRLNIGALHGMSVDYFSQRPDGGGNRWVYIGDVIPGQTIATWSGGFLSDGGQWINNSDAGSKADFRRIDPGDVLDRVANLPIQSWRYRIEDEGVRHLGPTAQDFHATFGLGLNDKSIGALDASGVALAAIQGLNAKHEAERAAKDAEIATLRAELAEIRALLAERR